MSEIRLLRAGARSEPRWGTLFLALVLAASSERFAFANPIDGVTEFTVSYVQGWNYLPLPFSLASPLSKAAEGGDLDIWPDDGTFSSGSGHWVYARAAGDLTLVGTPLEPHDGAWPPEEPGWHVFSLPEPRLYDDPTMVRLLYWDAIQQRYVEVPPGTHLQKGLAYWALRRQVPGAATAESAPSGPAFPPGLFPGEPWAGVTATDWSDGENTAPVTLVFDPDAPQLVLVQPAAGIVYQKSVDISGWVADPDLAVLTVTTGTTSAPVPIPTVDGRFRTTTQLALGPNTIVVAARNRAGHVHKETRIVEYRTKFTERKRPRPPSELFATLEGGAVFLRWRAPELFEDGTPIPAGVSLVSKVVRGGLALTPYEPATYYGDPTVESGRSYRYSVTTAIQFSVGDALESEASHPVDVWVPAVGQTHASGDFEPAGVVVQGPGAKALPRSAITRQDGKTYAHVAYLSRAGASDSDQVHYLRSEKAGKPGSFGGPQALAKAALGDRITDLAVGASENLVSIVWVEAPEEGFEGSSRIFVRNSKDGGGRFEAPIEIRGGYGWKRSIAVAYDRLGHHHLVWNEANKVYYLKNLDGPPENVFDETKRVVNDELADYDYVYARKNCDEADPCGCPNPVNEVHTMALEEDPGTGEKFGPYRYRVEEAYVENPSLHVDGDKVTIAAWQTRMFDNHPVRNPQWRGDKGPFVAPILEGIFRAPAGCLPLGSVAKQKGFRQAWKSDQYACVQAPPGDYEARYVEELLDPRYQGHLTGPKAYYSYDHRQGHEKNWYYYLYGGRWHEEDRIKVAQRPLVAGAWSKKAQAVQEVPVIEDRVLSLRSQTMEVEQGFHQGSWKEDTLQNWRMSTADSFTSQETAVAACGATLADAPVALGPSYPKVVTTPEGDMILVYEKGPALDSTKPDSNRIYIARSADGGATWTAPEALPNEVGIMPQLGVTAEGALAMAYLQSTANDPSIPQTPKPIDGLSHTRRSNVLWGAPTHSVFENLVFTAWIRQDQGHGRGDAIVAARASSDNHIVHVGVERSGGSTTYQSSAYRVRSENQYHVQVASNATLANGVALGASATEVFESKTPDVHLADGTARGALASVVPAFQDVDLRLAHGAATLWTAADAKPPTWSGALSEPKLGNYDRAVEARNTLLSNAEGDREGPVYQIEYTLDAEGTNRVLEDADLVRDAQHLARYDRVWAYTQGIALAQFARHFGGPYSRWARSLARYVCDQAEWDRSGAQSKINGWNFSWNTREDVWRDARLVTGATAWVIHGLGAFMVSDAFSDLLAEEQEAVFDCYTAALRGLEAHRRVIPTAEGQPAELVSAGWTTAGLLSAEQEGLRYYSVLDAIGYEDFDPEAPPPIEGWPEDRPFDASEFAALKERVPANNIVTEHNLDVLSVLNHAVAHAEVLGLSNRAALESWRDALRIGIFTHLWDDQGWKSDLEHTEKNPDLRPEHRTRLAHELGQGTLGRMVTGGTLTALGNGQHRIVTNNHVAIDNCSWLALSVDYESLKAFPVYEDRLARCLEYTVLQFAKPLKFGGKTYYGTHYFQNAFRDQYIDPSDLQESSYHLEATTGLILGLHAFAVAHPDHPKSAAFRSEALRLWAGVQTFVADHGFPYSSQRIQDLSTLLSSSTAVIWFIDVHDALETGEAAEDRPLRNYATGVNDRALEVWAVNALQEATQEGRDDPSSTSNVVENQALGLLAAVAQDEWALAETWALRLMGLGNGSDASGAPAASAFEESASRGSRFLAAYALARFARYAPESLDEVAHRAQALYEGLLLADRPDVLADGASGKSALYKGRIVGTPRYHTVDNVYAYFAFSEAQKETHRRRADETASLFGVRASQIRNGLLTLLWNADDQGPLAVFPEDPEAEPAEVAALYALFAAAAGDAAKAERALALSTSYVLTQPGPHPSWHSSVAGWVLAQRAVSGLDPRLDDLARLTLYGLFQGEARPSLAAVIAERPNNSFGVLHESPQDDAIAVDAASQTIRLLRALDRSFVETVGALFASSPDAAHFDHLLMRLAQIRELWNQAETVGIEGPFEHWRSMERVERTAGELLTACRLDANLQGLLKHYTGLPCAYIESTFAELLVARGLEPDRLGSIRALTVMSEPETQAASWRACLTEVGLRAWAPSSFAHHADFGHLGLVASRQGTWAVLETVGAIDFESAPTASEVRFKVRERLRLGIEQAMAQVSPGPIRYERYGLDLIAAFHPESPAYYSRAALEFRVAYDSTRPVEMTYRGHLAPMPQARLSEASALNRQTLRRFINTFSSGRLAEAARTSKLSPTVLHAMLGTGVLTQKILRRLAAFHGLSAERTAEWEAAFAPSSPDSGLGAALNALVGMPDGSLEETTGEPEGADALGRLYAVPSGGRAFGTPYLLGAAYTVQGSLSQLGQVFSQLAGPLFGSALGGGALAPTSPILAAPLGPVESYLLETPPIDDPRFEKVGTRSWSEVLEASGQGEQLNVWLYNQYPAFAAFDGLVFGLVLHRSVQSPGGLMVDIYRAPGGTHPNRHPSAEDLPEVRSEDFGPGQKFVSNFQFQLEYMRLLWADFGCNEYTLEKNPRDSTKLVLKLKPCTDRTFLVRPVKGYTPGLVKDPWTDVVALEVLPSSVMWSEDTLYDGPFIQSVRKRYRLGYGGAAVRGGEWKEESESYVFLVPHSRPSASNGNQYAFQVQAALNPLGLKPRGSLSKNYKDLFPRYTIMPLEMELEKFGFWTEDGQFDDRSFQMQMSQLYGPGIYVVSWVRKHTLGVFRYGHAGEDDMSEILGGNPLLYRLPHQPSVDIQLHQQTFTFDLQTLLSDLGPAGGPHFAMQAPVVSAAAEWFNQQEPGSEPGLHQSFRVLGLSTAPNAGSETFWSYRGTTRGGDLFHLGSLDAEKILRDARIQQHVIHESTGRVPGEPFARGQGYGVVLEEGDGGVFSDGNRRVPVYAFVLENHPLGPLVLDIADEFAADDQAAAVDIMTGALFALEQKTGAEKEEAQFALERALSNFEFQISSLAPSLGLSGHVEKPVATAVNGAASPSLGASDPFQDVIVLDMTEERESPGLPGFLQSGDGTLLVVASNQALEAHQGPARPGQAFAEAPEIKEISWGSDRSAQFVLDFEMSDEDQDVFIESGVIECSYDKDKLGDLPYQRNEGIIRFEVRPTHDGTPDIDWTQHPNVDEKVRRALQNMVRWHLSAPFFSKVRPSEEAEDKDLTCKLWLRKADAVLRASPALAPPELYSPPASFPLRPWREWTPTIEATPEGTPAILIPIADTEADTSVLESLPRVVKVKQYLLTMFDCGPTGNERTYVGQSTVKLGSFIRRKRMQLTHSAYGPLKWNHHYCIDVYAMVTGGGPAKNWLIRVPEREVVIPESPAE